MLHTNIDELPENLAAELKDQYVKNIEVFN